MVSHIGIGRRDLNTEHHWEELDSSYRIERPTLLIIGGSSTLTPKAANGYAKILSAFMGLDGRSIDIASVYYKDLDPDDKSLEIFTHEHKMANQKRKAECQHLLHEHQSDPSVPEQFFPNCIRELFENHFVPLISDNEGKIRLSLEEAKFRMRNVNILTHCYGGYVTLMLEKQLAEKMNELGYTPFEQSQIQKQMTVVSLAPPYGLGLSKSTTLSVGSVTGDAKFSSGLDNTFNNFLVSVSDEYRNQPKPALAISKLSDNETVIGVYSGNHLDPKDQKEHTIDYFTEGNQVFTKMIRCFLESALVNSIKNANSYGGFLELPTVEDAYIDESTFGITATDKLPDYPERMRSELEKSKDLNTRFARYQERRQLAQANMLKFAYAKMR